MYLEIGIYIAQWAIYACATFSVPKWNWKREARGRKSRSLRNLITLTVLCINFNFGSVYFICYCPKITTVPFFRMINALPLIYRSRLPSRPVCPVQNKTGCHLGLLHMGAYIYSLEQPTAINTLSQLLWIFKKETETRQFYIIKCHPANETI